MTDSYAPFARLREEYEASPLERGHLAEDPVSQFGLWFQEACDMKLPQPDAMTLATIDDEGFPEARNGSAERVFRPRLRFLYHHGSNKGRQLHDRPSAALVFYWHPLPRSVRIQGTVERNTAEADDAYFSSRPRGSQLAAWASNQSRPIASREEIERAYWAAETRYEEADVPRPPTWGGFIVVPKTFEFWQGRPSRLHDRFRYNRQDGVWSKQRLAP